MSGGEVAGLAVGIAVILGGTALAYRYTVSPKAAGRMAEASRKYAPRVEKTLTPRQALLLYGSTFVAEVGAAVVFESVTLAVFAVGSAVFHAYGYRRAMERDRRG